ENTMSLIHMDGFTHYPSSTSGDGTAVDSDLVVAGYLTLGSIWNIRCHTTAGPRGGKCVALVPGGIGASYAGGFYRNFTTAASKVVVGYSFQIAGAVGANNVKFFNI